jgi:hypothetical protein
VRKRGPCSGKTCPGPRRVTNVVQGFSVGSRRFGRSWEQRCGEVGRVLPAEPFEVVGYGVDDITLGFDMAGSGMVSLRLYVQAKVAPEAELCPPPRFRRRGSCAHRSHGGNWNCEL